jgi:hypothetical protein
MEYKTGDLFCVASHKLPCDNVDFKHKIICSKCGIFNVFPNRNMVCNHAKESDRQITFLMTEFDS